MEVQHGGVYLYEPPQTSKSENDVKFVASGQEQLGERPYIIVSLDAVNKGKNCAVAVPFTTKVHKANAYRILLPAAEFIAEMGSQYAFSNSVALCDHVRVIDTTRIRKRIGKLSENGVLAIQLGLTFIFGIR
jgi:mRNA-degrading endonuclease toxin of MazEF toxin-antitoxin module